jgi:hypothetical protein
MLRGADRGHGTFPADGPVPRKGLARAMRELCLQDLPRNATLRLSL